RNAANLDPVLSAVLAPVGGELGSGKQQIRIDVILGDRVGRAARGKIAGDRLPAAAAVGALEEIRREVAVLVILGGDIHGGGVVLGRADPGDVGIGRDAGQSVDLPPVPAAVFADLNQPIIGADIQ